MSWKRKANQPSRLKDQLSESEENEVIEVSPEAAPKAQSTSPNTLVNGNKTDEKMEFAPPHFLPPPPGILNLSPPKPASSNTVGSVGGGGIPNSGAPNGTKSQREAASADIMTILRGACLSPGLSREDKILLLSEVTSQISGLKRQLNSPPPATLSNSHPMPLPTSSSSKVSSNKKSILGMEYYYRDSSLSSQVCINIFVSSYFVWKSRQGNGLGRFFNQARNHTGFSLT